MNNLYFALAFFGVSQFFGLTNKTNNFQSEDFQKKETFILKDSLPSCSQTEIHQNILTQHPEILQKQNQWEAARKARVESGQTTARRGAAYELPVVVHVIHTNGDENISDAQIDQAMVYLNQGFAADGPFDVPGGVETDFSFRLANRAPDGNPTTGVNRVFSTLTKIDLQQDQDLKDLIRWDPTCYINVWVVSEICSFFNGCSIGGYATLPPSHGEDYDGIVVVANYFGTDTESAIVPIHEMGHYLGLYHTFDNGCKNDDCLVDGDKVCDTPPDRSTARVDCADGANSCFTDVNAGDPNNPFTTDQNDQMENFMDYASCSVLFTEGQKERMVDAIENVRFSLLDDSGCGVAFCDNPVTANFSASATEISVGETVTFTDNSLGSVIEKWTIDGVSFPGNSFTFNEVGTFQVTLEIVGADPICLDIFSLTIKVSCAVKADFTVDRTDVPFGEIAAFTNTSAGATNFSWTVNDNAITSDQDFDFSSPTPGIYRVCLESENAFCKRKKCTKILVTGGTTIGNGNDCVRSDCEDCLNGIDDNGNGLIDFYDPDCLCVNDGSCTSPYYQTCTDNCLSDNPFTTFSFTKKQTQSPVYYESILSVADIDGDCVPEIIYIGNTLSLTAVDGITHKIKYTAANSGGNSGQFATADVDNDGMAEMFVMKSIRVPFTNERQYTLARFDYDPAVNNITLTWQSDDYLRYDENQATNSFLQTIPSITDFNQDGRPEVVIGNQVYDSQTGLELTYAGIDFNVGNVFQNGRRSFGVYNSAVAYDLLEDNACTDCKGLELVAGNQIFSVNIQSYTDVSQNSMTLVQELPGFGDGLTGVADFDTDGDIDVIISDIIYGDSIYNRLYVWDAQTLALIGEPVVIPKHNLAAWHSTPTIGDLDGDGQPEIVISGMELYVFEDYDSGGGANWGSDFNQVLVSSFSTGDHAVGSLLFDFNLDGKQEIVNRSRTELNIFDKDLNVLANEPTAAGTSMEYPVIADIDNDDEAELVTFFCPNGVGFLDIYCGKIAILESTGEPWANTRKTWNQYSFFNTNINEDGTIPKVQQKGHLVTPALNSFNQQYAIPESAADCLEEICTNGIDDDGDGLVDELDPDCPCTQPQAFAKIEKATCGNNGIDIEFEICNEGEQFLSGVTPISIYGADPTVIDAPLLLTFELPADLSSGECVLLKKIISAGQDSVFIVVNDDGNLPRPFDLTTQFPSTGLNECNYLDNISGIEIQTGNPTLLDLGLDQTVCDNGVFPLDAGDFETYRWFDGSRQPTVTVFEPGTYWVETTDICGNVQSDTILIEIDPISEVKLGTDLTVCVGDTVRFDAGIFDDYNWLPKSDVNCDTCQVFELEISQDTQIVVTVASDLGCFSTDTVDIFIGIPSVGFDSIFICRGDTISVGGTRVFSDTLLSQNINSLSGCDSILNTKIIINDSIFIKEKIEICAGDTAFVFGNVITQNDTLLQVFGRTNGCDSTRRVEVVIKNQLFASDELQFCQGDTAIIFGNAITENDTLAQIFTSSIGCDSTSEIRVVFTNSINTDEDLDICAGDTVMIFGNAITSDSILFETYNSVNGCDSAHEVRVTFRPAISGGKMLIFCEGDTAMIFGKMVTENDTISEILTATNGCDSLATLEVFFNKNSISNDVLEVCAGDTARVFGLEILSDTTVSETLQNFIDCDSIHTIEIIFNQKIQSFDSLQFCEGDTAFLFGNTFVSDTILSETLTAAAGCDSIQNLKISFFEKIETSDALTFCEGDTARVFGLEILRDTMVFETIQSINGCDSTNIIDIFFNQKIETFEQLEFCAGDTAFLFGNALTEDDTVFQISTSAIGCDSTHNIDVIFLAEAEKMVFDSLCIGDILLFFNDTISETGTYFQTVPSIAGSCDTNYVLTAEFFDNPVVDLITDTLISIDQSFEIPLNISDSTLQVIWSPNEKLSCENCSNPTVSLSEAATLEATITNKHGCSVIARINVRVVDDNDIYIPTGFSPNGDSNNDFFTAFSKENIEIAQLQIFDRWGGLLFELNNFEGNDPTIGWDGTARGMPVNSGVYVYKFLVRNSSGEQEMLAGDVTVLR